MHNQNKLKLKIINDKINYININKRILFNFIYNIHVYIFNKKYNIKINFK